MGKINTNNYPNRPVSDYQDDDMFILQDNGGETYTTNVGDIKTLIDNKILGKADKVLSATAGNLAGLDANGNLTDSGISVSDGTIRATELVTSDGVQANDISYLNELDMDGSSIYGVGTLNVNQIDVHDGQAVEFLTDILVNGAVADEDGNVLSNKADKVTNATSGHLAGLDSNGNLTDSGVSPTEEVTVEGNPVTFDSPFEQDAKSVVVSVKPIQDLHGYDHPWVGGAGYNQWNENVRVGYWDTNDGTYHYSTVELCTEDLIPVTPETTYYGFNGSGKSLNEILYYDVNGDYISYNVASSWQNKTFTTPANCYFITFNFGPNYGTTYNSDIAINYPATITTYSPYSNICPISGIDEVEIGVSDGESEPTTTTIPLPSTLYGGDVDVTEGSADNRFGIVDLGDLEWMRITTNTYRAIHSGMKVVGDSETADLKCEIFYPSYYMYLPEGSIAIRLGDEIWVRTFTDDLTEFENLVNGYKLVYPLATPTTLSFDPTNLELLEGTNVVTTNGEKVAVTYGRSLWQDIDELKTDTEGKLNKSDVADVEGDTASRPYAVNEFMLRADGFYQVTQPIAQNASITASNTTKTTIGAVLTALLNS